jgi:hypothetical protein
MRDTYCCLKSCLRFGSCRSFSSIPIPGYEGIYANWQFSGALADLSFWLWIRFQRTEAKYQGAPGAAAQVKAS